MTTSATVVTTTVPTDEPRGVRAVVRRYVITLLVLTAVVAAAPSVLPSGHAPPRPRIGGDWLFGNWLQWDAWWYVAIAKHGYTYRPGHMSAVAFFPVYPLIVRALAVVVPGGVPVAALVTTTTCGLATLVLFHRWCARRMSARASLLAVGALALYPYAWFLYGTAYSDALFLTVVLGAFLALEADHTVLAGVLGAIATATRPTGIVIVIGLVVVALDRRGRLGGNTPRAKLRAKDGAVLLSVVGIAAYCVWLAIRFGKPLAFIETEGARGWNQSPGMHTWMKLAFFEHVQRWPLVDWLPLAAQALMCLLFIAAVPYVSRNFGRGYGIYVLATALIPATSTADFMGVGRYLLPAFPVFALLGGALERRRVVRRLLPSVSALALVAGTALFASGYYLT
jgi:Gpi18-like mannosyltransferase